MALLQNATPAVVTRIIVVDPSSAIASDMWFALTAALRREQRPQHNLSGSLRVTPPIRVAASSHRHGFEPRADGLRLRGQLPQRLLEHLRRLAALDEVAIVDDHRRH